jgi:nucleotide-binding universal stress UspA family protein
VRSLSKILLPVDFSERAVSAASCAKPLACHFHAELILLHVLPPIQYQYGPAELGGALLSDIYFNRAELADRDLAGFLADEFAGLRVTRLVRDGDPAGEIVAFAHEQAVDLIIMPTHGYGPFRRYILGSNTAKVLHDADCPVWTGVHMENGPAVATASLRRILCAVDLGPQSEKTLAWATWLQKEFDAELTVLHATACSPGAGNHNLYEAAQQELAGLQRKAGGDARLRIETGDPAHVICAAARQIHADALVIGRGSAAGVYGRLRTNAYAIIRQSPCPVVSV